mgnify:CR=1 FL=1
MEDLETVLHRENPAMLEVNRDIAQATERNYNISKLRNWYPYSIFRFIPCPPSAVP